MTRSPAQTDQVLLPLLFCHTHSCHTHPPHPSLSPPSLRYVFSRGGPDRTLDLTYNKLYGEFPRFLVNQASDLTDSCLCATNFTVSAGNQLYCPTKSSLEGVDITPNLLDTFKQANYTCLLPKQTEPVSRPPPAVYGHTTHAVCDAVQALGVVLLCEGCSLFRGGWQCDLMTL